MVVSQYVVKKGSKVRFSATVGEDDVQYISLKGNYVVVKKPNETISYDKINDLQTITLYDGNGIPDQFREQRNDYKKVKE